MRIAITSSTYLPGNNGQAIFTIRLAEGLAREGHEVHAIIPAARWQYSHEIIHGVHVHRCKSINLERLRSGLLVTLFSRGQVQRIFDRYPPDIVHIQDHFPQSHDVAMLAIQMGIPVMGTNHFLPENVIPYLKFIPLPRKTMISLMWSLMLFTYNRLDLITTPSATAAGWLLDQKVRPPVLPQSNGVDTQRFMPLPSLDRVEVCRQYGMDSEKVKFIYVGRLDPDKRIDLLVSGASILHDQGRRDIQLVFVGQGSGVQKIQAMAAATGLGPDVLFLGYIPNDRLNEVYQAADIFAMPSPEEGQSIATLESMASGLPVLAANARALPELVKHGENGYLFETNNPASVAEGMAYLIEHRAEWARMGQASRARAESHGLQKSIHAYKDHYIRLVEARKKHAAAPAGIKRGKPVKKTAQE